MKKFISVILLTLVFLGVSLTIANAETVLFNYSSIKKSIVKVNNKYNSVVVDNIHYFVNIKTLKKDIDNAIKNKTETSSGLIYVNNKFHKYDIYNENNVTYIVFYKFRSEDDDSYPMPSFKVKDFKKIF